jgi:hypothetical protein
MTKQKLAFRNICKCIKKRKTETCTYFVKAPLAAIIGLSLWYKLGTPVFGEFLPVFSADPLKLCQIVFQKYPESTLSSWSHP